MSGRSCGFHDSLDFSGDAVVVTVGFANHQQEKLWVERRNLALSFAPECGSGCPHALPPCFASR